MAKKERLYKKMSMAHTECKDQDTMNTDPSGGKVIYNLKKKTGKNNAI